MKLLIPVLLFLTIIGCKAPSNKKVDEISILTDLNGNSLNLNDLIGVKFDILKNEWIVSKDSSVNYLAQFSKT